MPIREWYERIEIECSDHELPRAIAALHGSYQPDTYQTDVYISNERQETYLLPNYPQFSRNGVRERSYEYG